jgi:hypothetical protein
VVAISRWQRWREERQPFELPDPAETREREPALP